MFDFQSCFILKKNCICGRLYLYNRCLFMKYIVTFIIKSNVSAK